MLYYANGGPGPATKLLRVDVPDHGRTAPGGWHAAPAATWQVKGGWQPYDNAQMDILMLGEFSMIDASEVEKVQGEIRARYMQFH